MNKSIYRIPLKEMSKVIFEYSFVSGHSKLFVVVDKNTCIFFLGGGRMRPLRIQFCSFCVLPNTSLPFFSVHTYTSTAKGKVIVKRSVS